MNEQTGDVFHNVVTFGNLASDYMSGILNCSFTTIPNDLKQQPIFGHDHPLRLDCIYWQKIPSPLSQLVK